MIELLEREVRILSYSTLRMEEGIESEGMVEEMPMGSISLISGITTFPSVNAAGISFKQVVLVVTGSSA